MLCLLLTVQHDLGHQFELAVEDCVEREERRVDATRHLGVALHRTLSSVTQRAAQTVLGTCSKRNCSRYSSSSGASRVSDDNALYRSLTYTLSRSLAFSFGAARRHLGVAATVSTYEI